MVVVFCSVEFLLRLVLGVEENLEYRENHVEIKKTCGFCERMINKIKSKSSFCGTN
jgi:hypothetical protein